MNLKNFWDSLRDGPIRITDLNIPGTERILSFASKRGTPLPFLAYHLATAYHETAHMMQPVQEGLHLSDSWRKRNLRYYPWHGRGLVQITWKSNYKRMGDRIGVDLITDPSRTLDWDVALPLLFIGAEEGLYTGKGLNDYIDLIDEKRGLDKEEYRRARRVINGTDKDSMIADYAVAYEYALKAGGYPWDGGPSDNEEPDFDPEERPAVLERGAKGHWVRKLQQALDDAGYSTEVDGDFGPMTEGMVKEFQARHWDLPGVVSNKTWKLFETSDDDPSVWDILGD